jgi:hypothetical protein
MSAESLQTISSIDCDELTELWRAWLLSPGCGMWRYVYEHTRACPDCLALAVKARRHHEYLEQQREIIDIGPLPERKFP